MHYLSLWLTAKLGIAVLQELVPVKGELEGSATLGPSQADNYSTIRQILERLTQLCYQAGPGGSKRQRKHEQRLLRNMGAHVVVLQLLQIPYNKVETGNEGKGEGSPSGLSLSLSIERRLAYGRGDAAGP